MTSHQKVKYVLGVETSCDDTAIGIIDSSKNIKANIVLNQNNSVSYTHLTLPTKA